MHSLVGPQRPGGGRRLPTAGWVRGQDSGQQLRHRGCKMRRHMLRRKPTFRVVSWTCPSLPPVLEALSSAVLFAHHHCQLHSVLCTVSRSLRWRPIGNVDWSWCCSLLLLLCCLWVWCYWRRDHQTWGGGKLPEKVSSVVETSVPERPLGHSLAVWPWASALPLCTSVLSAQQVLGWAFS